MIQIDAQLLSLVTEAPETQKMKKFFGNLPVKQRLNLIILSICSVTLLLTFVFVFLSQWFLYQKSTPEELQTLAKVISDNSTNTLLSQQSSILKTTEYPLNNIVVASYSQNTNQKKFHMINILNSNLKQNYHPRVELEGEDE